MLVSFQLLVTSCRFFLRGSTLVAVAVYGAHQPTHVGVHTNCLTTRATIASRPSLYLLWAPLLYFYLERPPFGIATCRCCWCGRRLSSMGLASSVHGPCVVCVRVAVSRGTSLWPLHIGCHTTEFPFGCCLTTEHGLCYVERSRVISHVRSNTLHHRASSFQPVVSVLLCRLVCVCVCVCVFLFE